MQIITIKIPKEKVVKIKLTALYKGKKINFEVDTYKGKVMGRNFNNSFASNSNTHNIIDKNYKVEIYNLFKNAIENKLKR